MARFVADRPENNVIKGEKKNRLPAFFSSPEHKVLKGRFKGGDVSVVRRVSSTISLNIFSSQTAGPIWTKLGRNIP